MSLRAAFHLLLLRPLLRLLFGLHVQGADQLIGLERFVIVANHNSHLDALLLLSIVPRRHLLHVRPVAAGDHFGKSPRLTRWMDRLLAPVWVDRAGDAGTIIAAMSRSIDAGDSLILFPEGSRGSPGQLADFRAGIGCLLQRHPDLPVIPAHILGPERALPRGAALPLPIWNRIVLGPAQQIRGKPRDLAAALQDCVAELARAERARRHQRRLRSRTTFTVAVLGIDGSGKSTLATSLASALSKDGSACLISDELRLLDGGELRPLQPLSTERLRLQLSRRAKRASTLAGYKIPKLIELLLRNRLLAESRRWYDPDWAVMDGSPLLNMTAWTILYQEGGFDPEFCAQALTLLSGRGPTGGQGVLRRRFPELRWLQRLRLAHLEMPDAAILIDLPAEAALERIEARKESIQPHETREKLAKLRAAYRTVCEVAEKRLGLPTLYLDGTGSPDALTDLATEFSMSRKEERIWSPETLASK